MGVEVFWSRLAREPSDGRIGKWSYGAQLIAACNCDWGCPCNFNQRPTKGFCDGVYAGHITSGYSRGIGLEGLKWAWAGLWPGAIHEGRGTAKVWIDETASEEQRVELDSVLKGLHGGMPWAIFAPTIDTWLETSFVPSSGRLTGPGAGTRLATRFRPV